MNIENKETANILSFSTDQVADNYKYWRENGGGWADEYDQRKKTLLCYHIQELMLADFFAHTAPAKVLEYGCGVGRHLSYLTKIPGLEVYGYDQSQSMVNNCLRWCSQEWLDQHVTVGPPVSKLPYPDQHFDVVFTAEVLIHVRPADLKAILSELIRISRWQVLHLEPSLFFKVVSGEHNGCWNHDLISTYGQIGYQCELLPSGYEVQAPYRVILSEERPPYRWASVNLGLLRRLEQDIQPSLDQGVATNRQLEITTQQLAAEQAHRQVLAGQLAAEQAQRQTVVNQLAAEQAQRQTVVNQLAAEQTQKQALVDQLAMEQAEKQSLSDQLAATHDQLVQQQAQLVQQQAQLVQQQAQLVQQQAQLEFQQSQLVGQQTQLADLIAHYEHRLQSQDLMTRHWLKLTGTNVKDLFLNPRRISTKFNNWYRSRIKGRQLYIPREAPISQPAQVDITQGIDQQQLAPPQDQPSEVQPKATPVYHQQKLVVPEQYKLEFEEYLRETFFAGWGSAYLSSESHKRDMADHVYRRMNDAENIMIPWIEEVYDLTGKSVLEIGCGTGSTTVPFSLRASSMNTLDIDQVSVKVAKQRAALLGANNVNFHLVEPSWAQSDKAAINLFQEKFSQVDVVLMMALLEHMTVEERINALQAAWSVLKPGGIMIIYETPNRVGYFDWHSFYLPFFHSLPDQLAISYSFKTPRPFFQIKAEGNMVENLYRLGRGVSYHEFELALDFNNLTVINDGYSEALRQHRHNLSHDCFDGALLEIFQHYLPHIPKGFAKPSLDLVIQKKV